VVIVVSSDSTSIGHASPSASAVNSLSPDDVFETQTASVSRTIFGQRIHCRKVTSVSSARRSSSP